MLPPPFDALDVPEPFNTTPKGRTSRPAEGLRTVSQTQAKYEVPNTLASLAVVAPRQTEEGRKGPVRRPVSKADAVLRLATLCLVSAAKLRTPLPLDIPRTGARLLQTSAQLPTGHAEGQLLGRRLAARRYAVV